MNKFVYRTLCRNYERSAKAMLQEWRKYKIYSSVIKTDVMREYKESLDMLRNFLDAEGIVMPKPKWVYDDRDQSTWLFTPQKSLNRNFLMLQSRRR